MKILDTIDEMRYLTVENAPRYRQIMRIFYKAYEKMDYQLGVGDIDDRLRREGDFSGYTVEMVKQDLGQLVGWGSLTAIQDTKRVYTIEDYQHKQFRYSMTEFAVAIERLTLTLDNLSIESGALSPGLFIHIHDALGRWKDMERAPLGEVNDWWRNLQNDFKRLNQSYQDYLREFYSDQSGKLLQSVDFLKHKDLFISYLRDFVKGIQTYSGRIRLVLSAIPEPRELALISRIIESELAIPQPAALTANREEMVENNVKGQWESLKRWFVPDAQGVSESVRVVDITNEIIYQIIKNAELLLQLQDWGMSRKTEYRRYMELFKEAEDMAEAHKLAAHLFGIQHIGHYQANGPRETENVNSGVFDEAPMVYRVTPGTRHYHERVDKSGFNDRETERKLAQIRYLNQINSERLMMERYVKQGRLDVGAIDEVVPAGFRRILLGWIARASGTASKSGRTEYGQNYLLERKAGDCVLRCEDGDLRMPAYVLVFTA